MANELNYYGTLNQTGLTVIARVYNASGTIVGSDVSCSEAGSLAIYTGDMPTATIGQYGVRFFDNSDGSLLGQGFINWSGTQEIELNLDVAVSTRSSFNASNDQVVASNMRGTDGANTIAPDNAGIAEIKAKTDQLNFSGNDVQSVASNMRGTDNANTIAPDNAGIAANGNAITALNNISTSDVKAQADQALTDYDPPTKAELDASVTDLAKESSVQTAIAVSV